MAGSASINDVFGAFAAPRPKATPGNTAFGSPATSGSGSFAQRVVVGVGDMAVSNVQHVTLSTFALGSCIGLIVYDPIARAGGLLHLMLPDSTLAPDRAAKKPAMFADTGVPALFNALRGLRAERNRVNLLLAGGACVLNGPDQFRIGERNIIATRKLLALYGLRPGLEEVGGTVNRTVHLDIASGRVTMKLPGREIEHRMA